MMTVPYTPLAIANRFIACYAGETGIEHMKLQKLVYYSYGWWLASYGLKHERLTNEGPEIWKHGPVFSSLYAALKTFGRFPITSEQSTDPISEPERVASEDKDAINLIDWIWGKYGHLSAFALSDMTHSPETSWYKTAVENNFLVPFSTKIKDAYIFEEFRQLMLPESEKKLSRGNDGRRDTATN